MSGGQEEFEVLVIPADATQPCRVEKINQHNGLDAMQVLVGGYVEVVNVDLRRLTDPTLPPGVDFSHWAALYVNEEFRFLDLALNARASMLYPWQGGIYGDAFLAGPPTPDGYDTSVSSAAVQFYLTHESEGERS